MRDHRVRTFLKKIRVLPAREKNSFWKGLPRSLIVIVAITLAVFGLEYGGWLRGFETTGIDMLFLTKQRKPSENVVIVEITDDDYRDLFNSTSPLDAARVLELVRDIMLAQPKALGVDVDTSSEKYQKVSVPGVVWARDAEPVCAERAGEADKPCGGAERVRPGPVLGRTGDEAAEFSGVVLFPQDYDGLVRRYRRVFEPAAGDPAARTRLPLDSLPWKVARTYCDRLKEGAGTPPTRESGGCRRVDRVREEIDRSGRGEEMILNFAGDRYSFQHLSAQSVLTAAARPYWASNSPLREKVVLLGGHYRAARDEYVTPVGLMTGVELIANAVESDLSGGGIREVNWLVAVALDILAGLIIYYLNWRFDSPYAIYLNILAVAVTAFAFSLVAFNSFAYWLNFTAIQIGVLIHLQYDAARERAEMSEELEQYRERFGSIEADSGSGEGADAAGEREG